MILAFKVFGIDDNKIVGSSSRIKEIVKIY